MTTKEQVTARMVENYWRMDFALARETFRKAEAKRARLIREQREAVFQLRLAESHAVQARADAERNAEWLLDEGAKS